MVNKPLILWAVSREKKGEGQCDCACSDITSPTQGITVFQLPESNFTIGEGVRVFPLSPNWYYAFRPGSIFTPVVINAEAKEILDYFRLPNSARNAIEEFKKHGKDTVDCLAQSGLLSNINERHVVIENVSITLTVWLHITESCNLDCLYCYLPKSPKTLSMESGRLAIDAIFRSASIHGYKKIKIKYAGGEPTLHLQLISDLHRYALEKTTGLDISVDGVILSNGTLLSESNLSLIKELGLRLMISLDGVGLAHDVQRKSRNGRGNFQIVAQNIEVALESGLVPEISITVTAQNMRDLPRTVDYLLSRNLLFSINFYRANDLSSKHQGLDFSDEELIMALQETYKVIEMHMPSQSLLSSIIDRASFASPHTRVCAVGQDYMVINTNGLVSKCQMDMDNIVGSIDDNDPLYLVRADKQGIQNLRVSEKNGCESCDWMYWCAGGCPLSVYRIKGEYNEKSPNCRIYKMLFPEVLRLESLRILRNYNASEDIK